MITIKIGTSERKHSDHDEHWIAQMINRRKKDGQKSICVKVAINEDNCTLTLSSGGCPKFPGTNWKPSNLQLKLIRLWEKHHLNEVDISPGNLISFLKQLPSYL